MAREIINVGTNANDSTGDPLRTAFQKLNNMTAELYTDDASDVNSIVATAPIARNNATGIVTISLNDAGIVTDKIADDAVTTDKLANAINSAITANTAKVTNATHTGEVTGSGALTIASNAVTTTKILNDNITHDKLEARYTAEVAISTLTGTVAFDFSAGSSFKLSGDLTGAYTINITNYKKGQVVTIYPLKAQSVTLSAGSGTGVFYKVAAVDYDNSATSILQIECVDDQAANPVFFYSVATFAADSTI